MYAYEAVAGYEVDFALFYALASLAIAYIRVEYRRAEPCCLGRLLCHAHKPWSMC